MTTSSRPYREEDLPRLQAALADWRRRAGLAGYCHVGDLAHRIYEGLHGRGPVGDLVRVWEDGAVSGVALCARFGTAFDVFTCPELRGTEAELDMLRAAYQTTRRLMVEVGEADRWVVSDVYGSDRARADLLGRLGFERYRLWDHVTGRGLAGVLPEGMLPAGFSIRSVTMADAAGLAAVRNESFGGDWTAEEFGAVMLRPGYLPERELVVVAPDGRLAAFAGTWLDEVNAIGHFEPVGTGRDFRRLGLARALMCHGLAEFRRLGMRTATVEHDASNLAAARLYQDLGFEKRYETYGFRRAE